MAKGVQRNLNTFLLVKYVSTIENGFLVIGLDAVVDPKFFEFLVQMITS